MKKQELISAMSEMLDKIKESDSQEDTVNILKGSKLGKMYIGCLDDKDIIDILKGRKLDKKWIGCLDDKDICDRQEVNVPVPSVDEIAKMMING